jgi:glycosyltransferase involved in cell wall biosynthesis
MPGIAVIIPVYNRAATVLQALDSIAGQTRPPDQLMVVDDGSTDGTRESVHHWLQSRRPAFAALLLEQANRGAAAARNNGLARIPGCDLVAFLDSDDVWPADFLARTGDLLERSPGAVAISCDRRYVDAGGVELRCDDLSGIAEDASRWLFVNDGGIASCSLFRTFFIKQLAGFDERLPTGHDSELFLRLSLLGPWLHAPGEPVAFHYTLSQRHGEQTRVSETYADCHRRWAHVHEEFIDVNGGRRVLPPAIYRDRLARRWYWAGRQLMMNGRHGEARECFLRSLAWRVWRHKTWFRLLRTFLPTAA